MNRHTLLRSAPVPLFAFALGCLIASGTPVSAASPSVAPPSVAPPSVAPPSVAPPSTSPLAAQPQWGTPVNGLQVSIAPAATKKTNAPAFRVTLKNSGPTDTLLSLGVLLNNGKVQIPDQVLLTLTDAAGHKQELGFSWSVRGRLDEYRVPLRAGSAYSLVLGLDQLTSSDTKGPIRNLKPGKYQIQATLYGVGKKPRNWGQKDIGLMNYWKGKAHSNILAFQR